MRASVLLTSGSALLVLAGCAAAVPGYVPDKGRLTLSGNAKTKTKAEPAPTTPAQTSGPYVPTERERGYNCRRLTGVIQIKIQQLRGDESQQPTSHITSVTEKAMAQPMAGARIKPGDASEHSRDRARLIALNELMIEKKCGHFDLDTALDPANTGTPEPIRPAGKPPKPKKPR